ncbi:hypothetical protein HK099_008247 [Clydaea vesicula]|uniref:Uncharacterized protein n=1 Tax=Clydaea vesicula TaxID=447962 RepID=A0AAD5U529_9FUNG|nr:hypothetical protein HK099_008247 [Clydaea vesicula]
MKLADLNTKGGLNIRLNKVLIMENFPQNSDDSKSSSSTIKAQKRDMGDMGMGIDPYGLTWSVLEQELDCNHNYEVLFEYQGVGETIVDVTFDIINPFTFIFKLIVLRNATTVIDSKVENIEGELQKVQNNPLQKIQEGNENNQSSADQTKAKTSSAMLNLFFIFFLTVLALFFFIFSKRKIVKKSRSRSNSDGLLTFDKFVGETDTNGVSGDNMEMYGVNKDEFTFINDDDDSDEN